MKHPPQYPPPAGCKLYWAPPGYTGPGWGWPAGAYRSVSDAAEAAALPFDPAVWAADPGDPDRVFWPRRDNPPDTARTRWTIISPGAAAHLARMMAARRGPGRDPGVAPQPGDGRTGRGRVALRTGDCRMQRIPEDYGDLAPSPRPRPAMGASGFYRAKPCIAEARQWRPANIERAGEVLGWLMALGAGFHMTGPAAGESASLVIAIPAHEAEMTAEPGDWIIRLPGGEFRAFPDWLFRETYEPAGGRP